MSTTYNRQALHELLSAAFNNSDLSTLAFIVLPDVRNEFSEAMTSRAKIEMILDGALRHGRVPDLLVYIERENPYQYQRFAPRLISIQQENPAMNDFRARRLADLQANINREYDLLKQYEAKLFMTSDDREIARIKYNIDRQREAMAGYETEVAELNAQQSQAAPDTHAQATQTSFREFHDKLDAVSKQVATVEQNLSRGQEAIRHDLAQQKAAIISHIDGRHQETIRQLVNKLDENQIQLVRQLGELADQHKIGREEADALARLTRDAVTELSQRAQNQPQAAEWQKILAILEEPTTWEQKLKLTLPILPFGILAYESEISADTFTALPQMANDLKQAWAKLTAKLRRDTAQ